MAFLCPSRRGRQKKKKTKDVKAPFLGRITGSSSVDTLVRVGLEKQHGLSPEARMTVIQDFMGTADGELTAQTGDSVYKLYQENNWLYVITELGQEGFLPTMCVGPYDDLSKSNRGSHRKGDSVKQSQSQLPVGSANESMLAKEGSDTSSTSHTSLMDSHTTANPLPKPARTFSVPDVVSTSSNLELRNGASLYDAVDRSRSAVGQTSQTRSNHTPQNSAEGDLVTDVKTFIKKSDGKLLVLFPYESSDENDVIVERGEVVTSLNREDPLWTWVRRRNGQEGFVPSAFTCIFPQDLHLGDMLNQKVPAPPRPTNFHDVRELITLRNFTAQSSDDISVRGGDHVFADLANQIERDWLWVYAPANGSYGYIPKDNVTWPHNFPSTVDVRTNLSRPP